MQTKANKQIQTKKTFQWGVASASIDFMHTREVETTREGTDCGCEISPAPLSKPKRGRPSQSHNETR